jgi:hypothetical protein
MEQCNKGCADYRVARNGYISYAVNQLGWSAWNAAEEFGTPEWTVNNILKKMAEATDINEQLIKMKQRHRKR